MFLKKYTDYSNVVFTLVMIFALVGIGVSLVLTLETIELAKNTGYNPTCNINALFNCTSVMKSNEASLFGFPNPLLGLIGYSAVAAIAASHLFGSKMKAWFYKITNIGVFIAFIFSYWLLFVSAFKINALCPYCIASCISASSIFFALLYFNLRENNFKLKGKIQRISEHMINKGYYFTFVTLWFTGAISLLLIKFLLNS